MNPSKKMKRQKKQRKQKQKQKQKQIVKTNVKVNVQSSGGSGGSSMPSSIPQQPYYTIPPQFKDISGENVKLNNIIDTMKKQQEENKILMNKITQQELNKDMALNFVDNKEDNIILEDISRNQAELNDDLSVLSDYTKASSSTEPTAELYGQENIKRRGRPKLYEGETEEEKKIRIRLQKYEREQKKKAENEKKMGGGGGAPE